jgi:hypothetical protein
VAGDRLDHVDTRAAGELERIGNRTVQPRLQQWCDVGQYGVADQGVREAQLPAWRRHQHARHDRRVERFEARVGV